VKQIINDKTARGEDQRVKKREKKGANLEARDFVIDECAVELLLLLKFGPVVLFASAEIFAGGQP